MTTQTSTELYNNRRTQRRRLFNEQRQETDNRKKKNNQRISKNVFQNISKIYNVYKGGIDRRQTIETRARFWRAKTILVQLVKYEIPNTNSKIPQERMGYSVLNK